MWVTVTFSINTGAVYLSIFSEVGEHDHSSTLSVMDHLPHVPGSGLHWALSYDVGLLLLVALHIATEHELIET